MKKRLLPIALMAVLVLGGCANNETPDIPDIGPSVTIPDLTAITISNREELQKEWHYKDLETTSKDVAISLTPAGKGNVTALVNAGIIKITSSDTKVLKVIGQKVTPTGPGTATITVTFNKGTDDTSDDLSDSVEMTIGEEVIIKTTIKELREGQGTGDFVKGKVVGLTGRIVGDMSLNGDIDQGMYLQDGEWSVSLHNKGSELFKNLYKDGVGLGSDIYVKGMIDVYHGKYQIKPVELRKVAEGDHPVAAPTVTTLTPETFSKEALTGKDGRIVKFENLRYVGGNIANTDKALGERCDIWFSVGTGETYQQVQMAVNYHIGKEAMKALRTKIATLTPGQLVDYTGVLDWYDGPNLVPTFMKDKTPADAITVKALNNDLTALDIIGPDTLQAESNADYNVVATPNGASTEVTWSVEPAEVAKFDATYPNKLVGLAEGTATIKATSKVAGKETVVATKTVTITPAPIKNGPVQIKDAPHEGIYKLGMYQVTLGKDMFFTTEYASYRYKAVDNYYDGANVEVIKVTDGYNLKIGNEYISAFSPDGEHNNLGLKSEPCLWKYSEEAQTLVATIGEDEFYIGSFSDKASFGISKMSFINGADACVARLYDYAAVPTLAEDATTGTFILGMNQEKVKKTYYFTGKMAGFYYGTSTNSAESGRVTVAKTGNDYTIKVGEEYLAIEESGGHINAKLFAEAFPLQYDAELNIFTHTLASGKKFTFGTKNDGTFGTIGAVEADPTKAFFARMYDIPEYPNPIAIEISTPKYIEAGKTARAFADLFPRTALSEVVWTSSKPEFATINNGTITAVAAGTTTITATVKDTQISATANVTVIPAITETPVIEGLTLANHYDFSTVTNGKGEATADVIKAGFTGNQTAELNLTVKNNEGIYAGGQGGGAYENQGGLFKFGGKKSGAKLTLEYDADVKITLVALKLEAWPDGTLFAKVNGTEAFVNDTTGWYIFALEEASNVLNIEFSKRGYLLEACVYTAAAAQ